MSTQTFQIIATPAQRFALALFLLHKDLKFKGKRRTGLYRLRNALGLMAPTESLLGERQGRRALAFDKTTKNVFEVVIENAEFLNECLDTVELTGAQLSSLELLLSQLDEKKPSEDTSGLVAADLDAEDWEPSTAPVMDQPDRYVEVNAELLRRAKDFDEYRKLYLTEAEPPAPDRAPTNGRPMFAAPTS
jgi:hypothetical protein